MWIRMVKFTAIPWKICWEGRSGISSGPWNGRLRKMVRMVCSLCGASLPRDSAHIDEAMEHERDVHNGEVVYWKKVKG